MTAVHASCADGERVRGCQRLLPMSDTPVSRRDEIASLYNRYGAIVTRRCAYILKDEEAAHDATQEVFVKVMRNIGAFRQDASPLTWMLRIATNHCLNVVASQRAGWRERYRRYREHVAEGAGNDGDALERAEWIRRLLGRLDAETAQIAIHYYVDEMTQAEIATAIDRSMPTVRKRLAKFLRVAQKEFGVDVA